MSTDGIDILQSLTAGASDIPLAAEAAEGKGRAESPPVDESQQTEQSSETAEWFPEVQVGPLSEEESDNFIKERIEEITHVLNESARLYDISLRFRIEDEINRIIVTVFDKATEEVIRQVPPEEMVQIAKRMDEFVGLLFNEMA